MIVHTLMANHRVLVFQSSHRPGGEDRHGNGPPGEAGGGATDARQRDGRRQPPEDHRHQGDQQSQSQPQRSLSLLVYVTF